MGDARQPLRLPELIEGEGGVRLRRWTVDDAQLLADAIAESVDHLKPWMAWIAEEPTTLDQRRALLEVWQREWEQGGDVILGIFLSGRVAGGCGLHRRGRPDVLDIGYWIHPAFTGRGLATETARLLTHAALAHPGITAVEIHHDRANLASAGIPRRLGYEFRGQRADERNAPAEVGIDYAWRMERRERDAPR